MVDTAREIADLVGIDPRDLGDALRCVLRQAFAEPLEPHRVRQRYASSCRCSSTITCIIPSASAASVPGMGRMCLSAAAAVPVFAGIDHDDGGALRLRLTDEGPQMQIRRDGVGAPQV